jgi:hypothetical protein
MAGCHGEWGPRRAQARARRGSHRDRTRPAMIQDDEILRCLISYNGAIQYMRCGDSVYFTLIITKKIF